ncbi:uncharacterized protein [Chironomus tepperi]
MASNNNQPQFHHILSSQPEVKKDFIINITSKSYNTNEILNKQISKLITFSSALSLFDTKIAISRLNRDEFPRLFTFIISVKNFGFNMNDQAEVGKSIYELKKHLLDFDTKRPMVLQLTSEDENVTRFYYKNESSTEFHYVNLNQAYFYNFSAFLSSYLKGDFNSSENNILDMLENVDRPGLIIRFLQMLSLNERFFLHVIFRIAYKCNVDDFIAILDTPFDGSMTISTYWTTYLSIIFTDREIVEDTIDHENIADIFELKEPGSSSPTPSDNRGQWSILSDVIECENTEISNFLAANYFKELQNLSFNHKLKLSTQLYDNKQYDLLCNLIKFSDFPFPEIYHKYKKIECQELKALAQERKAFFRDISKENIKEVIKYIINNKHLKYAYCVKNKTAIYKAAKAKKVTSLYLLISYGYEQTEPELVEEVATKKQKEAKAARIAQQKAQRSQNITDSLQDEDKTVNLMCNKSLIFDVKNTIVDQTEYREIIRKCFKLIFKVVPDLINIASMCDELKILFDFGSQTVKPSSLADPDASGACYQNRKWIFIGAEMTDERSYKHIAGILAHELCHYLMGLVYENKENPFYKHKIDIRDEYEGIVKAIDKWSATKDFTNPDDMCKGIISSVYRYEPENINQELIVRVVQIMVEFEGEVDMLNTITAKYKDLFDFWTQKVMPDLQKSNLLRRKNTNKLNRFFEMIKTITDSKYEFIAKKFNIDIKSLNNFTIIKSNVPKLVISDIDNSLYEQYGDSIEDYNIYVNPVMLKNQEILNDFTKHLAIDNDREYHVIIDCSMEMPPVLMINKQTKFIYIVQNDEQIQKIDEIMNNCQYKSTKTTVNYLWNDLTENCQQKLLQKKIIFQNCPDLTLHDILYEESLTKCQQASLSKAISTLIDDGQVLNSLVEDVKMSINSPHRDDQNESEFKLINIKRNYIKVQPNQNSGNGKDTLFKFILDRQEDRVKFQILPQIFENFQPKLCQNSFLNDIKGKQYVLISGKAGNGKSWSVRDLMRWQDTKKWKIFVDLKQFITDFKKYSTLTDFSTYIVKTILKLDQTSFDAKLFQFLYKSGRVFIIFDGFDEIAPNYAAHVMNLAKLFEFNNGNQLCITTRDHFGDDLRQKLKIDALYNLEEFTHEDGINLIVSIWMLMDKKKKKSDLSFTDFVNSSKNLEKYKKKAQKIVETMKISKNRSLGMPQLFKITADLCKDKEKKLTVFEIYNKMFDDLYTIWADNKGELWAELNVQCQKYDMNFRKIHQYLAIERLFEDFSKEYFARHNKDEWTKFGIIACGIVNLKDDEFIFLHETSSDFLVADLIVKEINSSNVQDIVVKLFIDIVITKEYGIIRMFLNDPKGFKMTTSNLNKILKFKDRFNNIESLSYIFKENLDVLAKLVIDVFDSMKPSIVKNILELNVKELILNLNEKKMSDIFLKFIKNFFDIEDLKIFIIDHEVFQMIIRSRLNITIFTKFVTKIKKKTDPNFIIQALVSKNKKRQNIFYHLCKSQDLNVKKIKSLFKFLQKYLKDGEFLKLLTNCDQYKSSILQVCIHTGNEQKFKILWTALDSIFSTANLIQFAMSKDINYQNILHYAARCESQSMYNLIWELFLKTKASSPNTFMDIILGKDVNGQNFLHVLLNQHNNWKQVTDTFDLLRSNLSDDQFQDVLRSTGYCNMTLMQSAVWNLKSLEYYQFSLKFFKDLYKSDDDFLTALSQVDDSYGNILTTIVCYSINEVFQQAMELLKEIDPTQDVTREMLELKDQYDKHLFQNAVELNNSFELNKSIWEVYDEYFKKSEILEFIRNNDTANDNVLTSALASKTLDIEKLTWDNICQFMDESQRRQYLKEKGYRFLTTRTVDIAKSEWIVDLLKVHNDTANSLFAYSFSDIIKHIFCFLFICLLLWCLIYRK